MQITSEKIQFTGSGGESLSGKLETPPFAPSHWALFAHCFTCSKDIAAASRISMSLAEMGFGVLRFDFTGLGNSDGDFANTNFSSNVADLEAAAKYLEENHGAPVLLVGHSLGGAAVLVAASKLPTIKAVATIGAPYSPDHVIHNFQANVDEIKTNGSGTVSLGNRNFTIKKQFLDDLNHYNAAKEIGNLRKALCIFHSPQDSTVGIENAQQIYQHAHHPKSFISLDGADHLLSKRQDSEYVGKAIASWVVRYLEKQPATPKAPRLEPGQVYVEDWEETLTHKVFTKDHAFVADEPRDIGGNNKGPTPMEFLLWSLGTCTAMTLRMYSNRKNWELGRIGIKLEKTKAADGKTPLFQRWIKIGGDVSEDQLTRLGEIADKCPVHKILMGDKQVVTEIS